ncbi:MAG: patatin-like phospholipase family protein [Arenimonas sp.]|nr:patatin-like phospholipase family protein [Arenimonas sp.]
MKKLYWLIAGFILSGVSVSTWAAEPLPCRMKNPDDPRPRIGLVLGGGGARGAAHISVIKKLESLDIPIDCIAGTSMGALIGGLYASGMTSSELEEMVKTLDWSALLSDTVPRQERSFRRKQDDQLSLAPTRPGIGRGGLRLPSGILSGESIIFFLTEKSGNSAGIADFNQLSIPFRAVAADINTGKAAVLGFGSLPMAMRASMSIPGAFKPISIDGQLLVDGGMVNQVPIDVVRAMGADIVIAVDVGTPLATIDSQSSILAIGNQVTGFLTVGNTITSVATLTDKDILIRPQLGDDVTTTSFEPEKIALALAIGTEAAITASPRLAALSAPSVQPRQIVPSPDSKALISFIELNNKSLYDDAIFESTLEPLKGQPLDYAQIEKLFKEIYGQYPLDLLTFEVVNRDSKTGLLITAEPKQVGRLAAEFGMTFQSNQNSQSQFNLTVGALSAPFNASGGELRALLTIGSEPALVGSWHQPLTAGGKYFSRVGAGYRQSLYTFGSIFETPVAQYNRNELFLAAGLGRAFSNWGEAGIFAEVAAGDFEKQIGNPSYPEFNYQKRNFGVGFLVDTVDSLYLPREGILLDLRYVEGNESWGSSDSFQQGNLDFIGAMPFKDSSVFGGIRYHVNNGSPGLQNWFEVGGVTRFAAYQLDSVNTENYGMAFLGYNYRIGQLMGRNTVVGGTLEYGRIWGQTDALQIEGYQTHGSAFLGFDSWLGLFLLGYARNTDGASNWFVTLGHNQF